MAILIFNSTQLIKHIEIYNTLGELIYNENFAEGKYNFTFNHNEWIAGIYHLKICSDKETIIKKMIIK